MEPGGWSGARRPEARGPQADYMLPTRDLETPSSAADVYSLYADNVADKHLKIVEARRLTTSIPHATWKQLHSPQMCC